MRNMIIGLLLLVMTVVPCGPAAAEEAEPIKIALLDAFSGPFEYLGTIVRQSIELTVRELNEQGGLLGRPIQLFVADTELNVDVTLQRATEFILKEDIKFIIIGTGSHLAAALLPVVEEHGVVLFSGSTADDALTGELCSRYFFRMTPSTTMLSNALAFWTAMNGHKKVFAIAQDYSMGHAAITAFTRKLHELDSSIEIVGEEYHPLSADNLRPYIEKIAAAKPEVVVTPNWGADLITLVKQSEELGLEARFAGFYLNSSILLETLENPDFLIGSVGLDMYAPAIPTEKNREFVAQWHQATGEYPSLISGMSYLTFMYWAEAVKAAGTDEVEAVIDAWEGLIYDSPAGKWYMRPCDHQVQPPMWVSEIVKDNPFYDHPFAADATTIPVRFFTVPCEQTGCQGLSSN